MVLSELNVRHTRRHMPTRRIALGDAYLPTSGPAYGAVLLGAVVAEHLSELDDEQADLLPRLVREARDGLSVPRIALRYRLQTDTHGLDRSRHRIHNDEGRLVLELDRHARPDPQVIGAVMAAATLPPSPRAVAFRSIDAAMRRPGALPEGMRIRRQFHGLPGASPPRAGTGRGDLGAVGSFGSPDGWVGDWAGVSPDARWAMEVFGLGPESELLRADVQARFRRLVRQMHPDHGAARAGAAERLAELTEARAVLLGAIASADEESAG
jgi:hypothetical protein